MALTARLEALSDSVAYFREVVADGTVTADTLRAALAKAADQLDTLRGISLAYTQTVDSLRDAYAEERLAAGQALAKAESLIALQDSLIQAKRPRGLNRRTLQAFGVGVGVGILLVLAR